MRPEDFAVEAEVALMIVQIGGLGGGAEGLFAIPVADIVGVGTSENNQAGAKGVRRVRSCAELIHWNECEFRRCLAAAIGAAGMRSVGHIGDAGECLPV